MRDRYIPAFEEGGPAAPGVVDDLVRHDERPRAEVGADAADRGHRDDLGGAFLPQCPQVRAIVHLVWRDGVAVAMAGQENDVAAAEPAECQCARRLAVGRARGLAEGSLEARELRQPAPADDCEHVSLAAERRWREDCATSRTRPGRSRTRTDPGSAGPRNRARSAWGSV